MPPRRGRAHGIPVGHRRGRQPAETKMERNMRRMEERLEAMERNNHSNNSDDSDEEAKSESSEEEEEDPDEVKILKMLMKTSGRPRIEVPMYSGNLNVEELMDWINALSKYFDFEEIEDKKKVRYAATRLKGHATIQWDELHIYREGISKKKINSWDKMLCKIKSQFMPKDYQLNLIRQLHNLRKKTMIVKEYTE